MTPEENIEREKRKVGKYGKFLAFLIVAGVVFVAVLASRDTQSGELVSTETLYQNLKPGVIAAVAITDSNGKVVKEASVSISLHNGDGQALWRLHRPVAGDGIFYLTREDLPALPNVQAGVIAAEAPNYLAEKIDVRFVDPQTPPGVAEQLAIMLNPDSKPEDLVRARDEIKKLKSNPVVLAGSTESQIEVSPNRIHLQLTPFNPWLTLLVLLPAIFGLILAILHLTQFSRAGGMKVTYWYAVGTTALWSLVATALVYRNVEGDDLIPLFWTDLFVSSGVIIFAFLGSVVYVAFSMYEKGENPHFFESDDKERRRVLLTIGGRVLIAPYVAMTAYGIFASTFPTIRTGAFAAFFGFFTGLWIKAVIEALTDIGKRFLSAESAQKVADWMKRTEVSDARQTPTSTTAGMKPDPAFLNAVAQARQQFLKKEGVIGVAEGIKISALAGGTGQRAIVAYVYEKRDLPPDHADAVPDTFNGYQTDVVPLPAPLPGEPCHPVMFNVSWEKIYQDNEKRLALRALVPHASTVSKAPGTNVLILTDVSGNAFYSPDPDKESGKFFVIKKAYEQVRASGLADAYDFVAFVLDMSSGLDGNLAEQYCVPLFNDAGGIGFFKDPDKDNRYDMRSQWHSATTRLRACQVHTAPFISNHNALRTFLHELGHSWCSYVNTFKANLLIGDKHHWDPMVDVGLSCMNYVEAPEKEFVRNADGTYTWTEMTDGKFNFSPLDLYLMGIKRAEDVREIRVFDPSPIDGINRYKVATTLQIGDITSIYGARQPQPSLAPREFRQAFVVVTKNRTSGEALAQKVETLRTMHEKNFADATGVWTLRTDIG